MENQSRLEVLEGRVEELSRHWDRLFGEIARVDHKIDALGLALSARIDALDHKFDRRFEAIEQKFDPRFETVDRRFETVDRRFEAIDRQFLDLRAELSRQFRWTFSTMLALLGMMLTVGVGVATALLRG
jgi:chaperonin cofactor prefoldin